LRAKQINIAGAGPAGLTAAINLAQAGYQVDVYEKRGDTGGHFGGDLQGLENFSQKSYTVLDELRQMNIQVNFNCDPVMELQITNGKYGRVSRYDRPLSYLVRRGITAGSLDQGLKEQALQAGVMIHFQQTLLPAEADIVATGPIAAEIFAVSKGIVFATDQADTNIILVNDRVAHKGYSYLIINKGHGCLCTVLFERFTEIDTCYQAGARVFRELLSLHIEQPQPVAGAGCFSTKNVYQQGQTLYVGEAAGFQDFLWGFGLRTALQSGHLAAQCIIHQKDYAQEARATFLPKLKATLVSRFIWELMRFQNYSLIVNDQMNKGLQKGFDLSFFYHFGRVHQLLYPLASAYFRRRYPNLNI